MFKVYVGIAFSIIILMAILILYFYCSNASRQLPERISKYVNKKRSQKTQDYDVEKQPLLKNIKTKPTEQNPDFK